jgi:hypothetical protein
MPQEKSSTNPDLVLRPALFGVKRYPISWTRTRNWPDIGNIDATTISTAIMAQATPRANRAFFVRLFRSNVNSSTGEHGIACTTG